MFENIPDWLQGFWLKILTSLLECIADQINDILNDREQLPVWFTRGGACLYIKDPRKATHLKSLDQYPVPH